MPTDETRLPLTLTLTDARLLSRCLSAAMYDLGGFAIPADHWGETMPKSEIIIRVSAMAESLRSILHSVRTE